MAPHLRALFGQALPSLLQHLARFQPQEFGGQPPDTGPGPAPGPGFGFNPGGGNPGRGPGSAGQGGGTGYSSGPDQFSTGGGTPPAPVPENAFQAQLAKLLGWDWAQVLNQARHGRLVYGDAGDPTQFSSRRYAKGMGPGDHPQWDERRFVTAPTANAGGTSNPRARERHTRALERLQGIDTRAPARRRKAG